MRLLLEKGADLDEASDAGAEARERVRLLYGEDALIEADDLLRDEELECVTPLMLACKSGSVRMAELILENGGVNRRPSPQSPAPLHIAATYGRWRVARLLLRSVESVEVDARDEYGMTPLMCACVVANHKIARLLVRNGASVTYEDAAGNTPLYYAAARGKVKLLR